MLIELGADPVVALPPGSGTVPAQPGQVAQTFKPIEQARGWYTLYGYWDSAQLNKAPLYYQWTFTPGVRPAITYVGQQPFPPPPPMGQFLSLDSARAAMVSHLNMVSALQPQQPLAPSPLLAAPAPMTINQLMQPSAPQVYASPFLPTAQSVAAAQAYQAAADTTEPNLVLGEVGIPHWVLVAGAAAAVGLFIVMRRRGSSRR